MRTAAVVHLGRPGLLCKLSHPREAQTLLDRQRSTHGLLGGLPVSTCPHVPAGEAQAAPETALLVPRSQTQVASLDSGPPRPPAPRSRPPGQWTAQDRRGVASPASTRNFASHHHLPRVLVHISRISIWDSQGGRFEGSQRHGSSGKTSLCSTGGSKSWTRHPSRLHRLLPVLSPLDGPWP